ncbi:hypothetical protein [Microcystis sp. LE19-8.1F]|nr:hypothetical protein [Microcystis sp. LE19-8.1F]
MIRSHRGHSGDINYREVGCGVWGTGYGVRGAGRGEIGEWGDRGVGR